MDAKQGASSVAQFLEPPGDPVEEAGQADASATVQPGSRPLLGATRGDRLRVVILGAGFGGLEVAKALVRAPADVALVDQHNHHCFQPLLYQVATAALSPADIAWPIRGMLRNQRNARVVMARVTGVDKDRKLVVTNAGVLGYHVLVVATGAMHSYFGHDEWASVAPGLKRIEDATKIRADILLAFERAELTEDERERRRLMTFVVVGGGPTGVEMAGAIAEIAKQTLRRDFRRIDPTLARVVLLEAGPRLLPALPERLSRYAEHSLTRMGVEVRTGALVTGCDAEGVTIGNERIESANLIWAAGVTASPAAEWLKVPRDRNGRILVKPDLSVDGLSNVYAIGDTAAAKDASGKPVPGVAPAAKQMGQYVGKRIAAQLAGEPAPAMFVYRNRGELATIGRKSAVVKLGRLELTGLLGWLFWSVVHVYFLIGARNRLIVAFQWLWSYLTFQRGARLISS